MKEYEYWNPRLQVSGTVKAKSHAEALTLIEDDALLLDGELVGLAKIVAYAVRDAGGTLTACREAIEKASAAELLEAHHWLCTCMGYSNDPWGERNVSDLLVRTITEQQRTRKARHCSLRGERC